MDEIAFSHGADVVLSGFLGEAGATAWGHGYYLELGARVRWLTLAHELQGLRATRKISPLRMLGRELRKFISPHRHFGPPLLLAPDFLAGAEQAGELSASSLLDEIRQLSWPPDHRQYQADMIRNWMSAHAFGRREGMPRVPDAGPLRDKRVLEFCLAAPGDMKVRDGYPRYLIRRALDGILPKAIQWRTDKCVFAPDYPRRYRAQLGTAREFVAAIRPKDPVRLVADVARLQYLLNHPDAPPSRAAESGAIPRTIYLICFLRQFAEFRE